MAVHLKKPIIPIRLDDADYDDSILFDLVGLDFVDLSVEKKREAALNKLINTLLNMIPNVVVRQPNQKPNVTSLTNKEGFNIMNNSSFNEADYYEPKRLLVLVIDKSASMNFSRMQEFHEKSA